MAKDIYEKSLEAHKKSKGKLEVVGKLPLETKEDLSIAYSPGVAGVSKRIAEDLKNALDYTWKGNTVAVVTDGSSILGLGNLGPEAALPVMEGKAALFKRFGNVDSVPICLDTQDEEEIIKIVKAIAPTFGGINLEDISAPRCFRIEARLRQELKIPVMHDDQHGTAVVVLAGIINALKLRGGKAKDMKVVLSGAGSAGTAITKILLEYGFTDIIINDSKGAIYEGRDDLRDEKIELAKITNKNKATGGLAETIVGADIFIGVSKAGLLTKDMIGKMADKPIIFALANPEPEIMPELAKEAGAYIVATGRSDYPNQVNNVLAFPGIFRGALDNKIKQFDDSMFARVAQALADVTTDLSVEKIIPGPFDEGVMEAVAGAIR